MKVLVYTFSTNKRQDELRAYFGEIFILKKLKEDLEKFSKKILIEKPELVLGIGNSERSRIESETINRFNKNKKIEKQGPEKYYLEKIKVDLPVSTKTTDSFCNWSAYKLSKFVEEHQLATKIAFLHLFNKDKLPLLNKN
ncbi:hypothetical protein KA107_01415 [Candidatus Pacearchaeota archaeon]|nr:hypothetical protein [Candidatus Pacearchaeota archaeon]